MGGAGLHLLDRLETYRTNPELSDDTRPCGDRGLGSSFPDLSYVVNGYKGLTFGNRNAIRE